ncbi:MAG: hypothetical protein HY316_06925 [Acidobacteria bacterium]|nr:hypothetical protein [Acidobacteriota bacterium]
MEEIGVSPSPFRMRALALLRDKRVWAALLAAAVLLTAAVVWAAGSYHRAQARNGLNEFAPFANPALELMFPRLVIENEASRKILDAGIRDGMWTLHARGGTPPSLEVRLTNEGQRWFSGVGDQIVATFTAGTREATRIEELEDIFPSRRVRFRYRWTQYQSASAVLGAGLPEIGQEQEGEALFLYENGQWRPMHWTTPAFDEAVDQFKSLEPAPR